MNFFQTIGSFFSIIWDAVNGFPIFNTGLTFGTLLFGMVGLSVLFSLLRLLFGFSLRDSMSDLVHSSPFRTGSTGKVKISQSRRHDER